MTLVLPQGTPKKPSFSQQLNAGIGRGLEAGTHLMEAHKKEQQFQQENEALKSLGINASGIRDPKLRQVLMEESLKGQNQSQKFKEEMTRNEQQIRQIESDRKLPKGSLQAYASDPKMAEQISRPVKEAKVPLTEKPVPVEISKKMKKIVSDNPKANADDLRLIMDEEGIPPVYSNPYTENRRRTEEQINKNSEDKIRVLRQETLPIRKQLAEKSMAATQGIQNKEHLLELIEKGNIDDPTYAAVAQSLPLNLGKRLLSNDTVEYKAGLIEEFGDLKNLFQGATRVKEIELLEEKIADLYLTDDQKRAILKSRINALKADQIRAETAQEIENEPYGVLQFNEELDKRAKPKLDALFNRILDEQKSIIQDAENKKKIPLNINDPEDRKIAESIIQEAGGDKVEARKLAKKKGYSL